MEIFMLITGFVVAYLLGSVPTSVWIGKWFYNVDVRTKGSGNAGATNVIRVLGWNAGIPVFIIDICKGFFAVWIMKWFVPESWGLDYQIYMQIVAGVFAVVGHTLPVFAGFRGGKGVATLFGAGIALYGWAVLVPLFLFILIIAVTRYVSLGSLTGAVSFPFIVIFAFKFTNAGLISLSIFIALFIIWTHRKNMVRLITGEENRFTFKKKERT